MVSGCSSSEHLAERNERELNNLDWRKVKVLVYTKNGKGFVHDNILSIRQNKTVPPLIFQNKS